MAIAKPKNSSIADAMKELDENDALEKEKNKKVLTTKTSAPAPTTSKGRGKRTVVPKKTLLCYIPEGMYYQLEELCKRSGMSKNGVVSKALYDYLENENKRIQNNG